MNLLRARIATAPKAALIVGKAVLLLGAVLVIAAVFGRTGMVAVNSGRAQAKLPPLEKLAQAYPQYPTWLVPEGPVGYTVAAVLVLAGMVLAVVAGDVLKEQAGRRDARW